MYIFYVIGELLVVALFLAVGYYAWKNPHTSLTILRRIATVILFLRALFVASAIQSLDSYNAAPATSASRLVIRLTALGIFLVFARYSYLRRVAKQNDSNGLSPTGNARPAAVPTVSRMPVAELPVEEAYVPTYGIWQRMMFVFTAPRRAFEDIVRITDKFSLWYLPITLSVIVSLASLFTQWQFPESRERKLSVLPDSLLSKWNVPEKQLGERADSSTAKSETTLEPADLVGDFIKGVTVAPIGTLLWSLIYVCILALLFRASIKMANMYVVLAISATPGIVAEAFDTLLVWIRELGATISPTVFTTTLDSVFLIVPAIASILLGVWSWLLIAFGIAAISELSLRKAILLQVGLILAFAVLVVLIVVSIGATR